MGKDETPVITVESQRDRDKVMFDSLRLALSDVQSMIRGYDQKAQVLVAVLTFAVGTIGKSIEEEHPAGWLIAVSIAAVTLAFLCCAAVLYPRAPGLKARKSGDYSPSDTYFLPPALVRMDLRDLVARVRATDWVTELVFELQKLASVRQRKAYWFRWAFVSTGAAVLGLFAILMIA
jgi:hypothetical protein